MRICKRRATPDEDLPEAGPSERQRQRQRQRQQQKQKQRQQWVTGEGGFTRVTGVTRGDGTEEGKGEEGQRGDEGGIEEGELLRTGGTTSKAL